MFKNWINGILGLVVVGVAFIDISASTLVWTLSVVGAVIAVNGFWGVASEESDQTQTQTQSHRHGYHRHS